MIPEKLNTIIKDLQTQNWVKALSSLGDTFIVGGSVRDSFLNNSIKDIDLVAEIPLQTMKDALKNLGKVDIVGESFSVLIFKPIGFVGEPFEIATPRMDRKIGEGHKGFEVITEGVDIITDLKRRDFTINSIAVNIKTGELLDPFNGLDDLKNKIIRATDVNAFVEDPLRILRGIQFASRFGFTIDEDTFNLMKSNSDLIVEISGERIFDEFIKIINKDGDTQIALNLIHDTRTDVALFGRKMDTLNKGFEKLDKVSFFYTLGILGKQEPAMFVRDRLKGDGNLVKAVQTLEQIFSLLPKLCLLPDSLGDEELRFMLFKAINKSKDISEVNIFPDEINEIISLMESKLIPSSMKDINANGDDVMALFNLKGEEVGLILEKLLRDALMNKFDWKDRASCIDHIQKIGFKRL